MINLSNKITVTLVGISLLSLASCARFDNRMKADGDFDYQNATLVKNYKTGSFSNDEARSTFVLPMLTTTQKKAGFLAEKVDIRPPTQLISVLDGVFLDKAKPVTGITKVLFHAQSAEDNMVVKVWKLVNTYLVKNKIKIASENISSREITTALNTKTTQYGYFYSGDDVVKKSSYKITVKKGIDKSTAILSVELLSYEEINNDTPLQFKMADKSKQDIQLRFINNLLVYGYHEKEARDLKAQGSKPLAIKLGFDDNHQTSWIVNNSFEETWKKLPDLLKVLHFEIVGGDKNLGLYSVDYSVPGKSYWKENNLKPFELKWGYYYLQLGEIDKSTTSISWLDSDKKPVADQKVTDVYLSITDRVRSAIEEQDKQTKSF